MKTELSAFILKGVTAAGLLLINSAAWGQPAQPPAGSRAGPQPTSSNPWESLPAMSADRCTAEALGTASDPKTGAPVRASVDPQTGKPLCPTVQSNATPAR